MAENILTQDLIVNLFDYDNGFFYWKVKLSKKVIIGNKVGSIKSNKYLYTRINRKPYYIHRLIFLFHFGYMPKCIDHINGNTLDNRIENLREANSIQNACNSIIPTTNSTGIKNVDWHKNRNKWRVSLRYNGKKKTIGHFNNLELAELVAIEARNKYHGEFANHG